MNDIQSLSISQTNHKVLSLVTAESLQGKKVLDVGAGEGYFVQLLGDTLQREWGLLPREVINACDLEPALFKYEEIECKAADFHRPLPYEDHQFDWVTSIEVIEHLEDQFLFLRELYRVTKPGGTTVVTTPNIMNINSRIRSFFTGFGLLYDILPLKTIEPTLLSGHIHPISLYFLAYGMYRAGYKEVEIHYDRLKKSGLFLSVLFYPFIQIGFQLYRARTAKKKHSLLRENQVIMQHLNTLGTLASRTIIVVGKKG